MLETNEQLSQAFLDSHETYEQWKQEVLGMKKKKTEYTRFAVNLPGRSGRGAGHSLVAYGNAGVRHPLAIKCLHAQVAAHLGGCDNIIGELVVDQMKHLHGDEDCLNCPEDSVRCTPENLAEIQLQKEKAQQLRLQQKQQRESSKYDSNECR